MLAARALGHLADERAVCAWPATHASGPHVGTASTQRRAARPTTTPRSMGPACRPTKTRPRGRTASRCSIEGCLSNPRTATGAAAPPAAPPAGLQARQRRRQHVAVSARRAELEPRRVRRRRRRRRPRRPPQHDQAAVRPRHRGRRGAEAPAGRGAPRGERPAVLPRRGLPQAAPALSLSRALP